MRNLEVKNKKERSIYRDGTLFLAKKRKLLWVLKEKSEGNTFVSLLQNYLKDGGKGDFLYISNLVLFRIKQYKMFLE